MSSFDGKIGGEGGTPVDATSILAALAGEAEEDARRRRAAVSCYLAASDGWREASALLEGAFAPARAKGQKRTNDR